MTRPICSIVGKFKVVDGKIHVPDTPGFGIMHEPGPGVGPAKG
jgi:hypothetical protein